MSSTVFADSAKVMPKGQVTIPKDVRGVLGINSGDRVTFLVDGSDVLVVNAATYAMRMLQEQMQGQAAAAGITSEEDITNLVNSIREEK